MVANDVDVSFGIESRRMQRNPLLRGGARQIILGQIGPVVRGVWVGIEQCDGALVPFTSECLRGTVPGSSGAHDHDGLRTSRRACSRGHPGAGLRQFAPNEYHVVLPLHLPAGHIVERGGPERLAGSEAEAGVMPGTTNGVAHQQAFRKGPAVMAAHRADGKPLLTPSGQQDRLFAHVARQQLPLGNAGDRNAGREIWAGYRSLFAHYLLLRRPSVRWYTGDSDWRRPESPSGNRGSPSWREPRRRQASAGWPLARSGRRQMPR